MLNGAVEGMRDRLMPVGFLPAEATALAQAAYLPPGRQAAGSLPPIRPRPEISHVINHAEKALTGNHMGSKAHLTRIALWETVFGDGSWHEEIIYTPEDTAYIATIKSLLTEPLAPGWKPDAETKTQQSARTARVISFTSISEASKPPAPRPLLRSAPVISFTSAPDTSPPAPGPLPWTKQSTSSVVPGGGKVLGVIAGIAALLIAGVNFMVILGYLLEPDDPTRGVGYLGVLLVMLATVALTGMGGATACGLATRAARKMLVASLLASAVGYLMVGVSLMVDIDSLLFPGLLNLGGLVLAAAAAKSNTRGARS